MNGAVPTLQVPDLGQLRQPGGPQDIIAMIAGLILGAAGVAPGGPSRVLTADDQELMLDDTGVVVVLAPAGPLIVGLNGKRGLGIGEPEVVQSVFVPWHAVARITGRTLP